MARIQNLRAFLWFDDQAEEAARFYTSIFEGSRITGVTHYPAAGQEVHGRPPGSVMTVAFELDGHPFVALNGGPQFRFTEAVSFEIDCETQAEIDYFWDKLSAGGDPAGQQCGWLKDRYGLSWQVAPAMMSRWQEGDPARSARVMTALLKMKKLDLAALQRAYDGKL